MTSLPTGTVTFLFTDIEGSTKLAQAHPEAMTALVARHNQILNQAIETYHGFVFQIVGDSFAVAFHTAHDALNAALQAQRSLQSEGWSPAPIKARMGIHTGAAQLQIDSKDSPYSGYATLALTQRIMSAGHGGQILLSQTTHDLTRDRLPEKVQLIDMGERRLKDILHAEHLYQLGAPDLLSEFAPLNTLDKFRNNLPHQLTSFVGREKEIGQIKQRLEKNRLVTLTGSGGIGKTRLSIQVAVELLNSFPAGVWLIELAPLADPALVPQAVMTTLDLQEDARRAPLTVLTDYLREKTVLLVLDNCEHVIDACAQLTEQLLMHCPNVCILASSREALGIEGEVAIRVSSLSLPPIDAITPENVMQSEAAQLFIDRATTVLPGFMLTTSNVSAIAQVCRRLDGVALAIELAAGRVKVLQVEQIADRLDDAFRLLTGGRRTALPRQQTLRATIDWSYNLLSDIERTLLRRLTVFAGGAMLEAVETICSSNGLETLELLDVLTQLVNKSLVVAEREQGKETRYSLLETIRQYAREKLLESNEIEHIRSRHLDYFCGLAEAAEPKWYSADREPSLERFTLEHDNLRAALRWAAERGRSDMELRLAGAFFWFWYHRGYLIEGCRWLEEALSHSSADVSTAVRAKALLGSGHLIFYSGDFDTARIRLDESVRLWRDIGNQRYLAYTLVWLGVVAGARGDCRLVRPHLEESIALFRMLGDEWGMAVANMYLGANEVLGLTEPRDQAHGRSLLEECSSRFRRLGDQWQLGAVLYYLGIAAKNDNNTAVAQLRMEESLAICRQVGDKWRIALILNTLGDMARAEGNFQRAAVLYSERLTLRRELGWSQAWPLSDLGYVSLAQGDAEHASAFFVESLQSALQRNETNVIPTALTGLAGVACTKDRLERATRLLATAERLTEITKESKLKPFEQTIYDRNYATVRAQLGEATFNAAWTEGRALTMEQAIEYALEENE